MKFKHAILLTMTTIVTPNVMASDNAAPGDQILVRCEGWFNPETEAKNIAAFTAMMEAKKLEAAPQASSSPVEEKVTEPTKVKGEIDWTPEMRQKLDQLVDLCVEFNRQMYDIEQKRIYEEWQKRINMDSAKAAN